MDFYAIFLGFIVLICILGLCYYYSVPKTIKTRFLSNEKQILLLNPNLPVGKIDLNQFAIFVNNGKKVKKGKYNANLKNADFDLSITLDFENDFEPYQNGYILITLKGELFKTGVHEVEIEI